MLSKTIKGVFVVIFGLTFASVAMTGSADAVRIGFGDIPAMDTIAMQTAMKRLNDRGIAIEPFYFKSEELANQALMIGQVDISSGTPYAIVQKMNSEGKAKIRMFFQRLILQYVPVVRTSKYQDWKDLDGEEFVVHGRGSGTEAQVKTAEKNYGIKLGQITYVPGTEVRGNAMMNGTIDASVIGLFTMNMLMEKQPGQWKVLPLEGVSATDDALFARLDWLQENEAVVGELLKELLLMYRRIQADPSYANELKDQYNLMPDLPPEITAQIPSYYTTASRRGLYKVNGGGEQAAKTDLSFYHIAGQLKGDEGSFKVEDFWYLKPLNDVLDEIGHVSINY